MNKGSVHSRPAVRNSRASSTLPPACTQTRNNKRHRRKRYGIERQTASRGRTGVRTRPANRRSSSCKHTQTGDAKESNQAAAFSKQATEKERASTVFAQRGQRVLTRVAQRRDEAHVGLELLARVLLRMSRTTSGTRASESHSRSCRDWRRSVQEAELDDEASSRAMGRGSIQSRVSHKRALTASRHTHSARWGIEERSRRTNHGLRGGGGGRSDGGRRRSGAGSATQRRTESHTQEW